MWSRRRHDGLIRYRFGQPDAARDRTAQAAGLTPWEHIEGLFPRESPVWTPLFSTVLYDEPIGYYRVESKEVCVPADWGLYDQGLTFAHEAGHAFDHQLLSDDDRQRFCVALGCPDRSWFDDPYLGCPAEAWAMAFAFNALDGPWRCDLWVHRHWPEDRHSGVLRACSSTTEAVRRRRTPAARAVGVVSPSRRQPSIPAL